MTRAVNRWATQDSGIGVYLHTKHWLYDTCGTFVPLFKEVNQHGHLPTSCRLKLNLPTYDLDAEC